MVKNPGRRGSRSAVGWMLRSFTFLLVWLSLCFPFFHISRRAYVTDTTPNVCNIGGGFLKWWRKLSLLAWFFFFYVVAMGENMRVRH
jgi:hypothetical protein